MKKWFQVLHFKLRLLTISLLLSFPVNYSGLHTQTLFIFFFFVGVFEDIRPSTLIKNAKLKPNDFHCTPIETFSDCFIMLS